MSFILLLLALPALSVLPGAWLAFGLPLDALGGRIRLALAVAFSPAVLGVQFLLLKTAGIPAGTAAVLILAINLPSLWLLWRGRPLRAGLRAGLPAWRWPAAAATALVVGGLLLALAAPWLLIDGMRPFAWHALLHTDIIYQLAGPAAALEEPELGGIPLAFAWLPHAYWVVLGLLTDIAPTRLYPVSNLLWLLVCIYLLYEIGAALFRLRPASALFGVGLALLGTQSVAYLARLLAGDQWFGMAYFGYRLSTIVQKFRGFETMPFAFALFLALLLVIGWRLRQPLGAAGAIEGSLLLGLGIVYPILFPVALVAAGSQTLWMLTRWARDLRPFARREIGALMIGLGAAAAAFVPVYLFYTQGTQGAALLALEERQTKTSQMALALLPFALLALPAAVAAVRRREGVTTLFLWCAGCSALLSVVINLGELEYKYVLTAALLLAPVTALTVNRLSLRFPRVEWPLALGAPLLLVALELAWTFGLHGHIPPNLGNAPRMSEEHFWLRLLPEAPQAGWVQAVREQTPPATLVVATASPIHLGPFVQRRLYAPGDADGAEATGYSMTSRANLVEQRRYPAQVYDQRVATVEQFMQGEEPAQLAAALAAMLAEARPLAIHFADEQTPALRWLQTAGIGEELFRAGGQTVWFVEPGALGGSAD